MKVEQRNGKWWVVDIPDTISEAGPYKTRAEAEQDRRGMEAFFRHEDDEEWFHTTSCVSVTGQGHILCVDLG